MIVEIVVHLVTSVLFDLGVSKRAAYPPPDPAWLQLSPPAPEMIDADAVIAAYRRLQGLDADVAQRLWHGHLTPGIAFAGVADFLLPGVVALPFYDLLPKIGASDRGSAIDVIMLLAMGVPFGIGLLLANSQGSGRTRGDRLAVPIGLFTGLILCARGKRRRTLLNREPFYAEDPTVLGPVVRAWARPLLNRANEILTPAPFSEVGNVAGLRRLGADPAVCDRLGERIEAAQAELRQAVATLQSLAADPESVERSPLVATGKTFAALRYAIAESERVARERDVLRRSLPFPPGSLEEPIRLNARG